MDCETSAAAEALVRGRVESACPSSLRSADAPLLPLPCEPAAPPPCPALLPDRAKAVSLPPLSLSRHDSSQRSPTPLQQLHTLLSLSSPLPCSSSFAKPHAKPESQFRSLLPPYPFPEFAASNQLPPPTKSEKKDSLFHPRLLLTALFHPAYFHSRSCSAKCGLNNLTPCLLTLANVFRSSKSHPNSLNADPANNAAPNAVDLPLISPRATKKGRGTHSLIVGRSTAIPRMSACNCIVTSLAVIPPSTLSTSTPIPPSSPPVSFAIASKIALVWKQVASSVARQIWCTVV